MLRKILYIIIMMAFLLVACQSTPANPTATLTEESLPEQAEEITPSAVPTQTLEASPTASEEEQLTQAEANCTVVSRQPTPSPTEQSLIPPVSETDWVSGAKNAKVTIIEYSDFQ